MIGFVANTNIIKHSESVMLLFIFRAINGLLVIQAINFAHTKHTKIKHFSFLHVVFTGKFLYNKTN